MSSFFCLSLSYSIRLLPFALRRLFAACRLLALFLVLDNVTIAAVAFPAIFDSCDCARLQSHPPVADYCSDARAVNDEGVFTGDSDHYVLCGFIRKEGRVSPPPPPPLALPIRVGL